ncbi:NIPSNAP family protein [Deminuibacter soli]|uniref:NIPSNAP family containing protein n=1 Tax=Deminuibacter soli TaxID=2291815 RepID=A0A3E1NIY5_9BACT|nr:NIPSNAP family protein [Deminuibacter soli]RFM27906.1 NIPSNAP family containing protein [Deminuibacter soli]
MFKKASLLLVALTAVCTAFAFDKKPAQEWYQLTIYHFRNNTQEKLLDDYLQQAYLPALHKAGIAKAGVFKWMGNDTSADKRLYVLLPVASFDALQQLQQRIQANAAYQGAAITYTDAAYNAAAYERMEQVILQAFPLAPTCNVPQLDANKTAHVYELRSYESPSEKLFANKVKMFNDGDEISIFKRLGFNAVFYASVIAGSHMPNLMYMTSFNSMAERDEHWKAFNTDAAWKNVSGQPQYQHNVSKAEITFLHPVAYSDL